MAKLTLTIDSNYPLGFSPCPLLTVRRLTTAATGRHPETVVQVITSAVTTGILHEKAFDRLNSVSVDLSKAEGHQGSTSQRPLSAGEGRMGGEEERG